MVWTSPFQRLPFTSADTGSGAASGDAGTAGDPADAKAALRKSAAAKRAAAARDLPDAADAVAGHADQLVARFGAGIYAAYLPIRSELSPLPLVSALLTLGNMQSAMPITPEPGLPLSFHHWSPGDALDAGPYGTTQPPADREIMVPRVILAPMLAFDAGCWRLGYGGGFYDRTIAGLRDAEHSVSVLGIAYAEQQVDQVPVGPFDMVLDGVITPAGILWPTDR